MYLAVRSENVICLQSSTSGSNATVGSWDAVCAGTGGARGVDASRRGGRNQSRPFCPHVRTQGTNLNKSELSLFQKGKKVTSYFSRSIFDWLIFEYKKKM